MIGKMSQNGFFIADFSFQDRLLVLVFVSLRIIIIKGSVKNGDKRANL